VVGEHLARSQKAVEMHLLRRDPDKQPRLPPGDGVMAEHEEPATRRAHEARHRTDQRRLASTVRAEQPEEGVGWNTQLEPVERARSVRIDLREPVDEQGSARPAEIGHCCHLIPRLAAAEIRLAHHAAGES
jgi:hypothetical protein